MRKLLSILTFMILFKTSSGQDTTKHYEFGLTLVTVDMVDPGYTPPTFEYVNGLFFRFTKKRFGLRLKASYSDNSTSFSKATFDSPYFFGGTINKKDLKLSVGGQFSIINHKEWLYSFVDISYRNVFSTGYNFGYRNETFSSTSNGFDGFAGIGLKLKITKYFFLSPEIGYYSSTNFVKTTTTSADIYNLSTGQLVSYKRNSTFTDINPVVKLHLTVKFRS